MTLVLESESFKQVIDDFEKVAYALEHIYSAEESRLKDLTDEWFESLEAKHEMNQEIASSFNESKLEACSQMLMEAQKYSELVDIIATDTFSLFQKEVVIPPKLISTNSLISFTKFVKSVHHRETLKTVTEQIVKKMKNAYREKISNNPTFLSLKESELDALCQEYKVSLAISDHERIRAEIIQHEHCYPQNEYHHNPKHSIEMFSNNTDDVLSFHVASHNVQERKKNGIGTFLSSMTFLNKQSKTVRDSLVSLMLREDVSNEHFNQILRFIKQELCDEKNENLKSTSDGNDKDGKKNDEDGTSKDEQLGEYKRQVNSVIAVCLQEVSFSIVEQLRENLCFSQPFIEKNQTNVDSNSNINSNSNKNSHIREQEWLVHCSSPTNQEAGSSTTKCEAITCIIVNQHRHSCLPLNDITVDYVQPNKIVTRHFAMVYFPHLKIGLVSIHVRHATHKLSSKKQLKQRENKVNIQQHLQAEEQVDSSIVESFNTLKLNDKDEEGLLNEENVNLTLSAVADRCHLMRSYQSTSSDIEEKKRRSRGGSSLRSDTFDVIENDASSSRSVRNDSANNESFFNASNHYDNDMFQGLKGIVVIGDFNANIDKWDGRLVKASQSLPTTKFRISSKVPSTMTAYGGQSSSAIDGVLWMEPAVAATICDESKKEAVVLKANVI